MKFPFVRRRTAEKQLDALDELVIELQSRIHRATSYLHVVSGNMLGSNENELVRQLQRRLQGED